MKRVLMTVDDQWDVYIQLIFKEEFFLILTSLLFGNDYEYDEKFSNFSVV